MLVNFSSETKNNFDCCVNKSEDIDCLYSHQPGQLFVNTNFWLFLADTITMDTEAKTPATAKQQVQILRQ